MVLEVPQELHQRDVVLPVRFGSRPTHFAGCESLGLHLHVHFRINICRVERDMPQPGTNRIDINPGTEQMGRRRVANGVRTYPLTGEGGYGGQCFRTYRSTMV